MNFNNVRFLLSAHSLAQLPEPVCPDIAFAGRSNVGKSSLINRLVGRRNLVKTSSKPGKTRSLNFFLVDNALHLVDLPGYGFARVSRKEQSSWQHLVTGYLQGRRSLVCVVVIIDLRHELKPLDRELVDWLRYHGLACLPVYTKADKLTRTRQQRHAAALDAALAVDPGERIIFSARTGQGCSELQSRLALYHESW